MKQLRFRIAKSDAIVFTTHKDHGQDLNPRRFQCSYQYTTLLPLVPIFLCHQE